MKPSAGRLGLVLAVVGLAALAIAGRSLRIRGERVRATLNGRMHDLAEAEALADRVIVLDRIRGELVRIAASGAVPDARAWIGSRLPAGTPDRALAAVAVEEIPFAGVLATTYRLSLDDIALDQAVGLLCDLHQPDVPIAVASVDLTPGATAPRFSLVVEIVAFSGGGGS